MRKPSPNIISNLASLVDGLLIWAATVCSFLSYEMHACAAHELLDQILSSAKPIVLEGQLSHIYRDALRQLFQNDEEQQLFKRVFGAITVLRESLPLHDFARLLRVSQKQIKGVQSRLTALQTKGAFDDNDDSEQPEIVPPASERFHASFIEFTMNQEGETDNPLIPCLIDPQTAHQSMAEGCLRLLNDFLSSFRGSECTNSDLRVLELYTIKFWPLHIANSNDCLTPLPPKLNSLLLELQENHLRQWGSRFLAISIPASSQNWDQVLGSIDKDDFYCSLAGFLNDHIMTDTSLTSSRTFCLEIAIRSQPKLLKAWEDLGHSYLTQFQNTSLLDMLNDAIIVYRHGLELWPKDGSQLTCMSGLADSLWYRFGRTGSMVDLNEAVSIDREALSLCPTHHPRRHFSLNNLGLRICERFKRTGSMADLEDSILLYRESLSLVPTHHPDRPVSLNNLANALNTGNRFETTRSMADLEEAVLLHRESLSLRPTPHSDRHFSLNNLATALIDCFHETGLMTDLQEAILLYRESLSLCPGSHPHHSSSLYCLANALQSHFGKTGSMTDLEEAILLYRESLSFRPTPHPDRIESLDGIGYALWDRFKTTGSMTDLEESISLLREGLSLSYASTHPRRLSALRNLADILDIQFKENGSQSDFEEAASLRQEIHVMSK